jgi:hypothetical protein
MYVMTDGDGICVILSGGPDGDIVVIDNDIC